jgi:hypothetical protein
MHLGHPMIFSNKDRNRAYNFIYSKFHAKFGSIKANKLNHAGRLQYIKSVLSSIPVYYMSTVLFSKTFIAKINAIIRKFWWAGIQDENPTNPIAFRSWDDICKPTNQGGLGIRDMELINKSLIIHTTWSVITNKNPILSNVLKAKYYPNSSFWTATDTGPRSVFWSSVLQVRHHLYDNSTIQIHAGNSSIWSSPWIPNWNSIHDNLLLPVTNNPLPSSVSDLRMQGTQTWNQDILTTTFTPQFVQTFNNIQLVPSTEPDILRWTPATNGRCTSKATYTYLQQQQNHSLPSIGSRAISSHTHTILNKIWKAKTIPPSPQNFCLAPFSSCLTNC